MRGVIVEIVRNFKGFEVGQGMYWQDNRKCRQTCCSKKSSPATNAATLLCHCLRLNESGDPAASNVTKREVHQTECVGSHTLFRSRFSKERIVAQRSSPTVFVPIFSVSQNAPMSRRAVPKIAVLLFLQALLGKFFGAGVLQQSFMLGTANCREKICLGKIPRRASMQTSVFDDLLEELADEQDASKKDLLRRLIKSEREKEQIERVREKEQIEREKEQIQIKSESERVILQKEFDAIRMELLSLKGGLTARSLLEHYAIKLRMETKRTNQTKAILANVDQLHNKSTTAASMSQIVQECSPQSANFCGRFLADLYAQLSGKIHNPVWSGPGIKVTQFLDEKQSCVVTKLAKKKVLMWFMMAMILKI